MTAAVPRHIFFLEVIMGHHSFEDFTPISSGHLDGAKHSATDRKMTVRYQNGYVYEVHGVSTEDYQAFLDAPSQGTHFHQFIKPNYHVERVK